MGLIIALSSRLYGTDDWVNLEVNGIAPKEAKYMTISFQASKPSKTTFFIDVVIFGSIDKFWHCFTSGRRAEFSSVDRQAGR